MQGKTKATGRGGPIASKRKFERPDGRPNGKRGNCRVQKVIQRSIDLTRSRWGLLKNSLKRRKLRREKELQSQEIEWTSKTEVKRDRGNSQEIRW